MILKKGTPQEVVNRLLSPFFLDKDIAVMMGFSSQSYKEFKAYKTNNKPKHLTTLLFNVEKKVSKNVYRQLSRELQEFVPPPKKVEIAYFLHYLITSKLLNGDNELIPLLLSEINNQ